MSWISILIIVVCAYFAIKVVGFALKMAFIVAILAAAYWLVAPMLGLPLPF
jgi:hypothetical protein